jgi:1-deoxy-D-xylulose-5-phosphate reductoisomerase
MTTEAAERQIGIAVLGSTGSVGKQALDVIGHHPERFRLVAITGGANGDLLLEQANRFEPELVVSDCLDPSILAKPGRTILSGKEGLSAAATHPDAEIIIVATSGHAAIVPTHDALIADKTVALANKETLVCAGELIIPLTRIHGKPIRPVDSEHSAIWQSLGARPAREIDRLILTASGGPFRKTPAHEFDAITVEKALDHPTWKMGGKISIDSATLMNKGLELIEAHWLFDVPFERLEVLVHPESIIHSIVEFHDRSQIAQLGHPDMRLPIQYALTYPSHRPGPFRRLDLAEIAALHFEKPDYERFPALTLAVEAGKRGGTYPTVLSAADELAVEAFLQGALSFTGISDVVAATLDRHVGASIDSFETIFEADAWARATAKTLIEERSLHVNRASI